MSNIKPPKIYKDLTGQVFNQLTVLEKKGKNKQGSILWKCLCSCGNTKLIITSSLKSGKTKSCGCIVKNFKRPTTANLINRKFGKLTVIKKAETKPKKANLTRAYWECLCDCENISVLSTNQLLTNHNQSCGCLKKGTKTGQVKKGNLSPGWKGGLTKKYSEIRAKYINVIWRNNVFKRDDYTCQSCNKKGGNINAHHIKSFANFPEGRYDICNGITLCYICHKLEHKRLRENAKA